MQWKVHDSGAAVEGFLVKTHLEDRKNERERGGGESC